MKFNTHPASGSESLQSDLLLEPVFQFDTKGFALSGFAAQPTLAAQVELEGFKGETGQTLVHYTGKQGAKRSLCFGVGESGKLTLKSTKDALSTALSQAKKLKAGTLSLRAPNLAGTGISAFDYGYTVGECAGLANYETNHQKTAKGGHKPEHRFQSLTLIVDGDSAEFDRGLAQGFAVAKAVNLARDLVTEPAGTMTPMHLAEHALQVANESGGRISVKFYDRAKLQKMGAGAFLAVAQGSENEPVLIEMSYEPAGADPSVLLALIGKSVTFDSGGYDIKPSSGMRTMKCDMSGGAATLAAISAIAALELPVRIKVLMAATENLVSGKAYKPGDVLHSMAGLTIEVDNTDAEGRLTLADAIEHAKRLGATHIVDMATLTGAIVVALGSVGAGVFGNNKELTGTVLASAASVGELAWELPLWDELAKANDSKIADIKNSGGAAFGAGSITAAHFLKRFAGDTPWVHIDIAGVAFKDEQGTGWGVKTLVALVKSLAAGVKTSV